VNQGSAADFRGSRTGHRRFRRPAGLWLARLGRFNFRFAREPSRTRDLRRRSTWRIDDDTDKFNGVIGWWASLGCERQNPPSSEWRVFRPEMNAGLPN
jgi:hypothetical protein